MKPLCRTAENVAALRIAVVTLVCLVVVGNCRVANCQQQTVGGSAQSFSDQVFDQTNAILNFPTVIDQAATPTALRPGDPGYWYERHSRKVKFRLRGRIDYDFLLPNQSGGNRETFGDLDNQNGFRRARIGAEGNLSDNSRYVGEIDLATGNVVLRDLYFALGTLKQAGEFRFGHMREPFSLEGGTSSNYDPFMERSPINTLDPARNWGIDYSRCGEHENWTFSAGLFQAGTDQSDFQFGTASTTAVTAKLTGLAWYDERSNQLMHFGLALSERLPDYGVVSFNQQPQSSLLSFGDSTGSPFLPKLTIPAAFQQLINVQWAYMDGRFWSQAEWYASIVDQIGGGPVFYHGSHADVGYVIAGGERKYLTKSGLLGAVRVDRPVISQFSSKPRAELLGYGAWEATARMSYLDFMDSNAPLGPQGQLTGVRTPQFTAGLNWYLADRMRIMLNYTYAFIDEANTGTTTASVLAMRLAMFW